jgi:hypothetical protein
VALDRAPKRLLFSSALGCEHFNRYQLLPWGLIVPTFGMPVAAGLFFHFGTRSDHRALLRAEIRPTRINRSSGSLICGRCRAP